MNIQEKLDFFQQLIQCNHNLPLHSFSPDFVFAHSDILEDVSANDDKTLILLSLEEPIRKHVENQKQEPLFIDDHLGLIWIVAFEYHEDSLCGIHALGPAYSGRNSYQMIKKELDKHNLSINIRAKVFRLFEHIPIIPTNQLFQYAVMLHYCVTGRRITTNDIQFTEKASQNPSSSEINLITEEHRGVWMAEQEFMNMLREGNPNYLDALARSYSLSDGPRFDTGDSLRRAKSTSIVLLTLCSRAAIEGGVSPSVAYTLNDYYMQMIEDSKNIAETSTTCNTLLEDYVQRVQQEKEKNDISGQIKSACDYIAIHIKEKLSITQLARQAGYTEYYFSHKFKNETGYSVSDYIKREKIRQAKLLLSGTQMSIQEISDELSFGSRSYFFFFLSKRNGIITQRIPGTEYKVLINYSAFTRAVISHLLPFPHDRLKDFQYVLFQKTSLCSKYNKCRRKEYHNRFHAFCLRRQGYFFLHGIHKQVKNDAGKHTAVVLYIYPRCQKSHRTDTD